ncbi:MAG: ABC transporter substrate-binding protein [Defluviitaleaceae bacterium]|nr:ABC transporter substrate-binding protein [Defluviitaleaceae bacterium]
MAKQTLRVGYLPIIDHLILGMTKEKQLEKVDLEMVQKVGWNEIGDALKAGEVDVAFMLAPYAMDLYYSEKNVKLLLLSHRDGSIVVANKRANINSLSDFKGKTVLIPFQASMHHILLHKRLQEEGLSVGIGKDVTTEVVAPSQIPMMIEYDADGFIAGYIVAEPFGTQVVNSGLGDILSLSKDIMQNHPCCAVVVKQDVVEKHPEAVQELITSLVESGKAVFGDIESTIKTAVDFLGQPEPVVRAVLTDPNRRVSMDKLMPKADEFNYMQDYLIDTVTTPALSGKIDVNAFLDLSFAKNAGAE